MRSAPSAPGAAPTPGPVFLLDLPRDEARAAILDLVRGLGEPDFRARQIEDALFRRGVRRFDRMTEIPAALRRDLAGRAGAAGLEADSVAAAKDGTRKHLFRLRDGARVESVAIPTDGRLTLCVSSQVGCPLACTFCATGYMGLRRNLTSGEIVEQLLAMLEDRPDPGDRRGVNVVFMGMGEPLLNLDAVLAAAAALNEPRGPAIGARRITVSTAGLPDGIRRLADSPLQLRLAVSLHAGRDEVRSRLMPINRRHPLPELLQACRDYVKRSGRRLSFEYVHLPGVNDSDEDVEALGRLLGRIPATINLIPFNEIHQAGYRSPLPGEIAGFTRRLRGRLAQKVTVRHRRGDDVSAACGQLWVERERRVSG